MPTINGTANADNLVATAASGDSILGFAGNDTLTGSVGNDSLQGGDGDDNLQGLAGVDVLDGGAGNDTLNGGLGNDTLAGGTGVDFAYYSGAYADYAITLGSASLITPPATTAAATPVVLVTNTKTGEVDTLRTDVEYLRFTDSAGVVTMAYIGRFVNSAGPITLSIQGGSGNDYLSGTSTTGFLNGAEGNDVLLSGSAQSGLGMLGGPGGDYMDGGSGKAFAVYEFTRATSGVTFAVTPGYLNGTSYWGTQADGTGSNDTLRNIKTIVVAGSAQADRLTGGDGQEFFFGNGGDDTIVGGAGQDGVSYLFGASQVNASLASNAKLQGIEELQGSTFADTLTGAGGNDALDAGPGNDSLVGGTGADHFIFMPLPYDLEEYFGLPPISLFKADFILSNYGAYSTGESDTISGFEYDDFIEFDSSVTLTSAKTAAQLLAREVRIDTQAGGTLITVGRDATAGQDLTLTLPGVDAAANARVWGLSADGQTLSTYFKVDPMGTWLADPTAGKDVTGTGTAAKVPTASTKIMLSSLNLVPGNVIALTQRGDYNPGGTNSADNNNSLLGLFVDSNGNAISMAVSPQVTTANQASGLATDIAQDFDIASGKTTRVVIPSGAVAIQFSARDIFFSDNTDPDNDYGVAIGRADASTNANDAVYGTSNADSLLGGLSDDVLSGGSGADTLRGGLGRDSLWGGGTGDTFGDSLDGGLGDDRFYLGQDGGSDTIDGGAYATLQGWPWQLTVVDGQSNDYDRLVYGDAKNGITLNLTNRTVVVNGLTGTDSYTNIEQIDGSLGSDVVSGKPSQGNALYFSGVGGSDLIVQDPYMYQGSWADGLEVGYWWSETGINIKWNGDTAKVDYGAGTGKFTGFGAYAAGTDTLQNIGLIETSNYDDVIDATLATENQRGYTTNTKDGTAWVWIGYRGGNDVIKGNGDVLLSIGNVAGVAPANNTGFTVDGRKLGADGYITMDLTGLKMASDSTTPMGTIKFSGVSYVYGTPYNDTLWAGNGIVNFRGQGGNDTFYGNNLWNMASYRSSTNAITVNLAAGTVTDGTTTEWWGSSQGSDTLRGVEAIEGTRYNDVFNAVGFSQTSTNSGGDDAGFLGRSNTFAPLGGNDTVTGNGYTRLSYAGAKMGIYADLNGGGSGYVDVQSSAADKTSLDYLYSLGRTTFTGVSGVEGGDYADYLVGGSASNGAAFSGMTSVQMFQPRGGQDTVDGGYGYDVVRYSSSPNPIQLDWTKTTGQVVDDGWGSSDTLIDVERVEGSNWADTLTGNVGNNAFKGNAGNDTIDGGDGTDKVYYSNARIPDFSGVIVDLGGTSSVLSTSQRALKPTAVTAENGWGWALDGSGDIDILKSIEQVSGSNWDDILIGSDGNNVLSGNIGNDTIDGADGIDWVYYHDSEAGVRVDLSRGLAENDGEGYKDVLLNLENVLGSTFADYIAGNGNSNWLRGEAGNDTLVGGGGDDTFVIRNTYDYVDASVVETDTVLDFNAGDVLKFDAAVTLKTGSGSARTQLMANEIYVDSAIDGAVVYLGRDSTPGADMALLLPGVNAASLVQNSDRTLLSVDSTLAAPSFFVTAQTPRVNEGGTATFTVTASGDLSAATTLYFSTVGVAESAAAGLDYSQVSNRAVTFTLAGSRTQTVSVPVPNDRLVEDEEFFTGILSAMPGGPALGPAAQVTIVDVAMSVSKTAVFLPSAGYVALNSPQVRTYGSAGDDSVVVSANASSLLLDQAVERVFLPARAVDYKFLRSGNQLNVYTSDLATLVLKTPLQSDADGTELVFAGDISSATTKAAASATLVNGDMKLGGTTVPALAPNALTWAAGFVPTKTAPTGPVTAMAFVAPDSGFSAASSGMQVFGGNAIDTVNISGSGAVTGVVVDQLVDNFQFDTALWNYSFMQLGNQLNVYPRAATLATSPIVNLTVQGDNDGSQMLFGSSSYSVRLLPGGVMKLGEKTVATDKPTPIDMSSLVKVGNAGQYGAQSEDVRFEVASGAYEYIISGFGSGDTLIFPAGSAPSLFNDSYSDNRVVLEWGVSGRTVRLNFTDISNDQLLNSVNDFNTVFGNGTFTFASAPATTAATSISAAGSATETPATNTTFTVATVASTYTYTIAGFGPGDKIVSPTGATSSVVNTNFTDGSVSLQYASGTNKVTITLTGMTAAQDALLTSTASINTLFGAGTFA